ncbi:MAG TPA: flagellar filament capping protein FliD [Chloroflexota bacterium]|nr:flagellar filament capping protein FliD [Chloroflexota bacterium]
MIDPSLLSTLNTLSALSPLFSGASSPSFANPAQLAANAEEELSAQASFPSQQALALSGLFTQALSLQNAAAQLTVSSLANQFLEDLNSPVLPLAPFSQTTASSSNPTAVTARSLPGATLTSYSIDVTQLAAPQVNAGSLLTSTQNSPIHSGTIDVSIDGGAAQAVNYNVNGASDNEAALEAVASALNQANVGVTATVNFDSGTNKSQLVVTANTSGTAGAFTLTDAAGNAVNKSGTGSATTVAQDALYSVNGVSYNLTSGNSFSLNNGKVTLNLLATTASPATITIGSSTSGLAGSVTNLVTAYNTLNDYLASNPSTISPSLGQQLQAVVSSHASDLASVGITVNSDASLSVNQTTLDGVAGSSPAQVQAVFAGPNGVATLLKSLAAEVGVSLQNVFAASLPVSIDASSLPTRLAALFGNILLAEDVSTGRFVNIPG